MTDALRRTLVNQPPTLALEDVVTIGGGDYCFFNTTVTTR